MDVRASAGTYVVIAVCMALMVGLGGFVAGRATIDADAAYEDGWTAGGTAARNALVAREGRWRGAIERAAFARGRARGMQAGQRAGFKAGRRQGLRRGEQAPFAGFRGGWSPGSWYAVRLAQGEGARGYAIAERVPLDGGRAFRLCGRGVCAVRSRPSSTAPTAATTGGAEAPASDRR